MTYKAKISTDRPYHRTPGTWKPLERSGGEMSATFTCPKCGTYGDLVDHEIRGDGVVTPSVICPTNCGFHDNIVLEGWIGLNGVNHLLDDIKRH